MHPLASQGGIPLGKFKYLVGFLKELGLQELEILGEKEITYDSSYAASEVLTSLSGVVDRSLNQNMEKSPCVTALADESTDITNQKRLVMYVQLCDPETLQPSNHYLSNVHCDDVTGVGIAGAILKEFRDRGCSEVSGKRDIYDLH